MRRPHNATCDAAAPQVGSDGERGGGLSVGVLGPLQVSVDGRPVRVTTGRLRALLVVLAMAAGRAVPVDQVAAALWGEDLPANARRSVQTYVTRLRAVLGAGLIDTRPRGYLLDVTSEQVDALRFIQLVDAAAAQSDAAARRARLVQALALWRGVPFADVEVPALAGAETAGLVERYLAALEWRVDLDLADGRHRGLVAELGQLAAEHPLRESLWARLLVALDRCGRPAQALARYEMVRQRIAEELGADPGPELQRLHNDLLAGRPLEPAGGTGPGPGSEPEVRRQPAPRQLPAGIDGFAGRAHPLKQLDALLTDECVPDGNAVRIAALHGPAGVGKTTLAVHWAYRVRDRFPDGQLYVDLRGYHCSGLTVDPVEALCGFLDALGVPQHQLPSGLATLAGRYRSLLSGRRVLIVLDNARDAEHVRPLLPGSPGCLVVVTSRNQLTGLVTAEGAHSVGLDLLTLDEARQLLSRRLGHDRVAAEPHHADDICRRCAGLPLALAIVAARAATHPGFRLAELAEELRDAHGLDAFTARDRASEVREVFSWSYRRLSERAARLFRLLPSHPGPDLTITATASLAGLPVATVRPLLAELAEAHLVAEPVAGRFTSHDLLRSYAAELTRAADPEHTRNAAAHRVLDHYLHTAHAARRLLRPNYAPVVLEPAQPGVATEPFTTQTQALAWFTAEYPVLLRILSEASRSGYAKHTWRLALALWDFLERQGRWNDLVRTESAAMEAARHLEDDPGQRVVHQALGMVYARLGRDTDALRELRAALHLADECGNAVARGEAHRALADVLGQRGDHTGALEHAWDALAAHRAIKDRDGQGKALAAIGRHHAESGHHEEALDYCRRALAMQEELSELTAQAATWETIGYSNHRLGRHRQALEGYRHAINLHRQTGHRHAEAHALQLLGDVLAAVGDPAAARDCWLQAVSILDELGHPDVPQIRGRLQGV